MTHPVVERVARAIGRASVTNVCSDPEEIERQVEDGWTLWIPEARAAIAAMREPDDGMGRAGAATGMVGGGLLLPEGIKAETVWTAMIDHILAEPAQPAAVPLPPFDGTGALDDDPDAIRSLGFHGPKARDRE